MSEHIDHSVFAAVLRLVGLDYDEAAAYLNKRTDSIKKMVSTKQLIRQPSIDDYEALRELYWMQVNAAQDIIDRVEAKGGNVLKLGTLKKHAANWPGEGPYMAAVAHAAMMSNMAIKPPEGAPPPMRMAAPRTVRTVLVRPDAGENTATGPGTRPQKP